MGCGDQGHQHQARVTPSQSMTIRRLLHVRFGSFATGADQRRGSAMSADALKAEAKSEHS